MTIDLQAPGGLGAALAATIMLARSRAGGRVPVVGVAGPQGSGKTTLVQAWAAANPGVAAFSLDDVYLTAEERREIAERVHPLLATRGPPGTHDLELLHRTLDELTSSMDRRTSLPGFNKVKDDREEHAAWRTFLGPPVAILVDGWCLGATAEADEALEAPLNALEAGEDRLGRWRSYANARLADEYAAAWKRFDAILYLRAPSFDVVEAWRCQQEEGLLGRPLADIDRQRVHRFIAYFERITRHMLAGGVVADVAAQLDEARNVLGMTRPGG